VAERVAGSGAAQAAGVNWAAAGVSQKGLRTAKMRSP